MQHLLGSSRTALLGTLLLGALGSSTPLSAQADGTPIRVQTAAKPDKWVTGRAAGITTDSVGLASSGNNRDTLRYARSDLHRMDVSMGWKSNAGRGALIGAGVGLVIGAIWAASGDWEDCSDWGNTCGLVGAEVALISIGGGAAGGAIIGAFSHHEKWKEVPLQPKLSLGKRGRVKLGLGVAF